MLAGDSSKALLISDSLDSVQPKPESWLDKDFFKVQAQGHRRDALRTYEFMEAQPGLGYRRLETCGNQAG